MRSKITAYVTSLLFATCTHASVIHCPAPQQLQPYLEQYVHEIKPLPYKQCLYFARAITNENKNNCDEIYKNVNDQFAKDYDLQVINWRCNFFLSDKQELPNKYSFTFLVSQK